MKDPRPPYGARPRGTGRQPRPEGWAVALTLGALCIAACEYSQLVYASPSSASSLGIGDPALLATVTNRPPGPAGAGRSPVSRTAG